MAIPADVNAWLKAAGYRYHCFISWAHTIDPQMTACAKHLRDVVSQVLARDIADPQVFLDEQGLAPGVKWSPELFHSLCRSVIMLAVCSPVYYSLEHEVCGKEWLAMNRLSDKRLAGHNLKAIIPVIFRRANQLPPPVSAIEYIDISRIQVSGHHYYNTNEFRSHIERIIEHIGRTAEALRANDAKADCDGFEPPAESAFQDYLAPVQPFPYGHDKSPWMNVS